MGTSRSSAGPGPHVPLVPPWVPNPTRPAAPDEVSDSKDLDGHRQEKQRPIKPLPELKAPAGRFGPARRSLGRFAKTASSKYMRRGLGQYVHKGYGGAARAAHRMSGTAQTAGTLYGALTSGKTGRGMVDSPFDPVLLTGGSADEIMDALVEAVRPIDGTQDAEAAQRAIRHALSNLLDRYPNAHLLDLSTDQVLFATECYVAQDVYYRFTLDVGKHVQDKAPSALAAASRLKDVMDYIKQTVFACFRALRKAGQQLNTRRITEIAQQSLEHTFAVFEEFV